jgi:hypothetical protein
MYTIPPEGYEASHPIEANWTSYIIDIDGFRIFHAGDSKNIPEYEQLTGTIDVALLPLGPGCQTMTDYEVVQALQDISPDYFIPIHFAEGADVTFLEEYSDDIEALDCEIISLDNLQIYRWFSGSTTTSSVTSTLTNSTSSTSSQSSTSDTNTTSTTTTSSPIQQDFTPLMIGGAAVAVVVIVIVIVIGKNRGT